MPITLNTPFDPGSFDPGKTYDKVKVSRFELDIINHRFVFSVARGYLDGAVWVWARDPSGSLLESEHQVIDVPEVPPLLDANSDPIPGTGQTANPQFSILVTKLVGGDPNKTIYDRAAEEIYAWVVANLPEYAGTIDVAA